MPETETLSIDLLTIDGDTQARIKISNHTVDDYATILASTKDWPFDPIDVFHDGTDYFVSDGFHRTLAAQRLKRASIPCRVHNGTARDAKIFGMTANDKHGLRMSRADKRACVEWLLDHGPKMTQVEIAKKAGVTDRTVKAIVAKRRVKKGKTSPFASKTLGKSPEPEPEHHSETEATEEYVPFGDDPVPPEIAETQETPTDNPETEETPTETPKTQNGQEKVSAAKLVDALTKQHVGHIARGLTNIAKANGGEGAQFRSADAGLNQTITALQKMREGER